MSWTASNSMRTCNISLFWRPFSAPAAKFTITLQCEVFYLPPVQLLIKSWFHNTIYYWFYHATNRCKDKLYYYRTGSESQTTIDKVDILACPSIQLHWPGSSSASTQIHCFYGTHNFIAVCSTLPVNRIMGQINPDCILSLILQHSFLYYPPIHASRLLRLRLLCIFPISNHFKISNMLVYYSVGVPPTQLVVKDWLFNKFTCRPCFGSAWSSSEQSGLAWSSSALHMWI